MNTTLISFGELLKTYRKQLGLTQQQLARKLGIHSNTIGAWERGDYLPSTRGTILELARGLQLSEIQTYHLLEASLLVVAVHWRVPSPRNPFFTGHRALLQHLHTCLVTEQDQPSRRTCALSGLAGIGKTQIAIEYAYRFASDYAVILWADARNKTCLRDSFTAIARSLDLAVNEAYTQDEIVTAVLEWLMTRRDWLLIFDQVEESALVQRFVPASNHGCILLTTRLPALGTLAPCLEVPPLTSEESLQLLLSRLEIPLERMSSSEVQAAHEIARSMEGLPLALDQTATYIEETRCRYVEFLALARHDQQQVLRLHPSSATYPYTVACTFTLAFERLRQQNVVAAELLRVCCLLAPREIPEALLIRVASALSENLQAALADPFQLQAIFKDLLAHALLRRDSQRGTLSMHPLVQTVLKAQMPEAVQRAWIEQLVPLLVEQFLPVEQGWWNAQQWTSHEQLWPHVQRAARIAEDWQMVLPELSASLSAAARHFFYRACYEQAVRSQVMQTECLEKTYIADQVPAKVVEREEEDGGRKVVDQFVGECCVLASCASCRAADLWRAYQEWMRSQDPGKQLSRQAFAFHLKAKGCCPSRTNTSRIWYGLELKMAWS